MIASDPALLIQMQKLKARNYKLNSAATGMGGMLVQDLLTRGVLSDITSFDALRKVILKDARFAAPLGGEGIEQDIPIPPPPALFEEAVDSSSQRVFGASLAYAQVILEWALVLYKPPSMLTTAPLGNVLMSDRRLSEPSHENFKPASPVPTDVLVNPFPILMNSRATRLSMIEHRAVPETIRMWSEYFFCTHASYQAVCMASTCKSLPLCVIGLKMAVTSYYLSGQRAYYESIIRMVSYLLSTNTTTSFLPSTTYTNTTSTNHHMQLLSLKSWTPRQLDRLRHLMAIHQKGIDSEMRGIAGDACNEVHNEKLQSRSKKADKVAMVNTCQSFNYENDVMSKFMDSEWMDDSKSASTAVSWTGQFNDSKTQSRLRREAMAGQRVFELMQVEEYRHRLLQADLTSLKGIVADASVRKTFLGYEQEVANFTEGFIRMKLSGQSVAAKATKCVTFGSMNPKATKAKKRALKIQSVMWRIVGNLLQGMDSNEVATLQLTVSRSPSVLRLVSEDRNGGRYEFYAGSKSTNGFGNRIALTPTAKLQNLPAHVYEADPLIVQIDMPATSYMKHRKGGKVQDACHTKLGGISVGVVRTAPSAVVSLVHEGRDSARITPLRERTHADRGAGDVEEPPSFNFHLGDAMPSADRLAESRANRDFSDFRIVEYAQQNPTVLGGKVSFLNSFNQKDMKGKGSAEYNATEYRDFAFKYNFETHTFNPVNAAGFSAVDSPGEAELNILRRLPIAGLAGSSMPVDGTCLHFEGYKIFLHLVSDFDHTAALSYMVDSYGDVEVFRQTVMFPKKVKAKVVAPSSKGRKSAKGGSQQTVFWAEHIHFDELCKLPPIEGIPAACQPAMQSVIDFLCGCTDYTHRVFGMTPNSLRKAFKATRTKGFPNPPYFRSIDSPADIRKLTVNELAIILFAYFFDAYKTQHKIESLTVLWDRAVSAVNTRSEGAAAGAVVVEHHRAVFEEAYKLSGIFPISLADKKEKIELYVPHCGVLAAIGGHTRQHMDHLEAQLGSPVAFVPPLKPENGYVLLANGSFGVVVNLYTGAYLDKNGRLIDPNPPDEQERPAGGATTAGRTVVVGGAAAAGGDAGGGRNGGDGGGGEGGGGGDGGGDGGGGGFVAGAGGTVEEKGEEKTEGVVRAEGGGNEAREDNPGGAGSAEEEANVQPRQTATLLLKRVIGESTESWFSRSLAAALRARDHAAETEGGEDTGDERARVEEEPEEVDSDDDFSSVEPDFHGEGDRHPRRKEVEEDWEMHEQELELGEALDEEGVSDDDGDAALDDMMDDEDPPDDNSSDDDGEDSDMDFGYD
jgi:uncharacterized membrane protein YgcG